MTEYDLLCTVNVRLNHRDMTCTPLKEISKTVIKKRNCGLIGKTEIFYDVFKELELYEDRENFDGKSHELFIHVESTNPKFGDRTQQYAVYGGYAEFLDPSCGSFKLLPFLTATHDPEFNLSLSPSTEEQEKPPVSLVEILLDALEE